MILVNHVAPQTQYLDLEGLNEWLTNERMNEWMNANEWMTKPRCRKGSFTRGGVLASSHFLIEPKDPLQEAWRVLASCLSAFFQQDVKFPWKPVLWSVLASASLFHIICPQLWAPLTHKHWPQGQLWYLSQPASYVGRGLYSAHLSGTIVTLLDGLKCPRSPQHPWTQATEFWASSFRDSRTGLDVTI